MMVNVEVPDELIDKINSFATGHEKTFGELVVAIIEEKFEKDEISEAVYNLRRVMERYK